jgi:hypothetical protein
MEMRMLFRNQTIRIEANTPATIPSKQCHVNGETCADYPHKVTGENQFIYEVSDTVGAATGEFALYTNRIAECPLDVHVQLTACEGVEFSLRSDSTEPLVKPLKVATHMSGWTLQEDESLYLNISRREGQAEGPNYTLIVPV